MRSAEVTPISKQMTIVIGLCVVGLMAFGLALSYYRNILFDRQLILMQERNKKLKDEVLDGYALLQYYKSDQYRDKYAKENFGLFRQGEKVLIINQPSDASKILLPTGELSKVEKEALYEERLSSIRVYDQWRLFLFERKALEALQRIER